MPLTELYLLQYVVISSAVRQSLQTECRPDLDLNCLTHTLMVFLILFSKKNQSSKKNVQHSRVSDDIPEITFWNHLSADDNTFERQRVHVYRNQKMTGASLPIFILFFSRNSDRLRTNIFMWSYFIGILLCGRSSYIMGTKEWISPH